MCQANHFKEILMIINTDSRQRARERERQNDAHGTVYALAERTNCTCEENHLKLLLTAVNLGLQTAHSLLQLPSNNLPTSPPSSSLETSI